MLKLNLRPLIEFEGLTYKIVEVKTKSEYQGMTVTLAPVSKTVIPGVVNTTKYLKKRKFLKPSKDMFHPATVKFIKDWDGDYADFYHEVPLKYQSQYALGTLGPRFEKGSDLHTQLNNFLND